MGRLRKSWYKRDWEETEKITQDWIKLYCKITKRERELLEIIKERKMVRRDMLEIISPSYRGLGDNKTRMMNRSIRKLFENMCIDKVHEKQEFNSGNTPAIIALDRAGSLMLGIKHKPRIKHVKSVVNGETKIMRRLPANYRHINGINQLEVDTILFCERTGNQIVRWEHEKPQELHYGLEKITVIPDLGVELIIAQKPFYAFIEFDTLNENRRYKEPPILRDKIIKYKKYKLSKLWEKDYPKFPILIFVSDDEQRNEFWKRKCKENGLVGIGIYSNRFYEFLERIAKI